MDARTIATTVIVTAGIAVALYGLCKNTVVKVDIKAGETADAASDHEQEFTPKSSYKTEDPFARNYRQKYNTRNVRRANRRNM